MRRENCGQDFEPVEEIQHAINTVHMGVQWSSENKCWSLHWLSKHQEDFSIEVRAYSGVKYGTRTWTFRTFVWEEGEEREVVTKEEIELEEGNLYSEIALPPVQDPAFPGEPKAAHTEEGVREILASRFILDKDFARIYRRWEAVEEIKQRWLALNMLADFAVTGI